MEWREIQLLKNKLFKFNLKYARQDNMNALDMNEEKAIKKMFMKLI